MSSVYYLRQTQQIGKKIADRQKNRAQKVGKLADTRIKTNQASEAARKTKSSSLFKSKIKETERLETEAAKMEKAIATFDSNIITAQKKLAEADKNLERERRREIKRRDQAERKKEQSRGQDMTRMTATLTMHQRLHSETRAAIDELSKLPARITVLFLASNPLDQQQLRLDEEVRSIQELIRKSKHRDSIDFHSCWAVRPADVLQAINEYRPTVVHFSGHGSNAEEIIFQDDAGNTKNVTKEAITQVMKACSGDIRLVFFNTCYSATQAESVVCHVEAAIGMNTEIGDAAARVFSSQFYSAIGFGLSVNRAFGQAKAALMLENIPEENTPELFLSQNLYGSEMILVEPGQSKNGRPMS